MEALQRHDYRAAADLFRSVVSGYPEEKELHERVRLYLNICARHEAPREATPRTLEERVYAATLALNAGAYDEALGHLAAVHKEDPENDHACYMLAVAHAVCGHTSQAITHLQRAIELNPENRSLAKQDPDLDVLRREDGFRSAIDSASPGRSDRRRASKGRAQR